MFMIIWGTIIAIVAAVVLTVFMGPYGIAVLFAVAFGILMSVSLRTREIQSDLQKIKEKLGIADGAREDREEG
jgi:membrane protein implicated in regulation of membrane protease activity